MTKENYKELYKGIYIHNWYLHYEWLDEDCSTNRIIGIKISTEGNGKYSIHSPWEHVEYVDEENKFEIPIYWDHRRWECVDVASYTNIFTVFLRDKKLDEDLE